MPSIILLSMYMKTFLKILLGLVITAVLIILGISAFMPQLLVKPNTDGNQTQQSQETQVLVDGKKSSQETSDLPGKKVTTEQVNELNSAFLEVTGTVKATEFLKVYPATGGLVQKILVKDGEKVEQGQALIELSGVNGMEHPLLTQLKLAQVNYDATASGVQTTKDANNSQLKTAQIQLENAQNQALANSYDLTVFDQNLTGIKNGVLVMNDTLQANGEKNRLDLEKTDLGIEKLKDAIDSLEIAKDDTINDYQKAIRNAESSEAADKLQGEMEAALDTMDTQLKDLYDQLDQAEISYDSFLYAQDMGKNQILGQLENSLTQLSTLALNQQSMAAKLGYDDSTGKIITDPLRLAQESYNATVIRNQASLNQINSQLKIAKANLDAAKQQAANLVVYAPASGTINEVITRNGELVSQQNPVVSLNNPSSNDLKVGVSSEDADKIDFSAPAEVKIGGKYVPVPMKGISSEADAQTRLVSVTLQLPNISLRGNQQLQVRLPLKVQGISVPLDAVIIGSEEQYVFTVEDGVVKKVNVVLGTLYGDKVEIVQGLNAEDVIVVEGAKELIEGEKVS